MQSASIRVLVADDQPYVIDAVRLLLKTEGWQIRAAGSPADLLAALESGEEFDVALMDLNYTRDTTSGQEGLDLLRQLQQIDPALPVVVMTAWGSVETAVEAMRRGARDTSRSPSTMRGCSPPCARRSSSAARCAATAAWRRRAGCARRRRRS